MDVQDALEAFIGERRGMHDPTFLLCIHISCSTNFSIFFAVFNALLQIDRNWRGSLVATVRYGKMFSSEHACVRLCKYTWFRLPATSV